MVKNIQETVFEVIRLARQSGLRFISKAEIKEEILKTGLGVFDKMFYSGDKSSKLDRMLDQALYQLTKNARIYKKGRGKYSVDLDGKYKPVICRHLNMVDDKAFCPIKKCFIGNPRLQCELVHGTDFSKLVKSVRPMCPGYTDKKPTPVSVHYAREMIGRVKQERERVRRFNTPNPRDPESRFFLPNLNKRVKRVE